MRRRKRRRRGHRRLLTPALFHRRGVGWGEGGPFGRKEEACGGKSHTSRGRAGKGGLGSGTFVTSRGEEGAVNASTSPQSAYTAYPTRGRAVADICAWRMPGTPMAKPRPPFPYLITQKSGDILRVGIFLDFVRLTTRTEGLRGAYVRGAGRNRIDPHRGEVERLGTRTGRGGRRGPSASRTPAGRTQSRRLAR